MRRSLILLALASAASAANIDVYFEQNGKDTLITPSTAGLLNGLHYLQKAHGVLQEAKFLDFLRGQQQRTGRDVSIYLVDDRQGDKVWPHAGGPALWVGESYFQWPTTKASIRGLFAHEFSHTQDHSSFEADAYGPDGKHYINEEITQRAAMMEGWADYWGQHWDALGKVNCQITGLSLFREKEDKVKAGDYHWHPINSFDDEMANEEVVASILWKLDKHLPGGAGKVSAAFDATNDGTPRTLPSYLTALATAHSADAGKACVIVDRATGYTASDDRLVQIFGAGAKDYVSRYRRFLRPLAAIASLSLPAIGSSLVTPLTQGLEGVAGKLAKAGGSILKDIEGLGAGLHLTALHVPTAAGGAGGSGSSGAPPVDRKNPLSALEELIVR